MSRRQIDQRYVGIGKEVSRGMSDAGDIIDDACVFGQIPDSESARVRWDFELGTGG